MSDSWAIYDRLLDEIAHDAVVDVCLVGHSWTVIDSGGVGVEMTYRGDSRGTALCPPYTGDRLSEMAAYLRSWNLYEASLGMAAADSHFNYEAWRHCQEGAMKGPFENGGWTVQIARDDVVPGSAAPAGAIARGATG